MKLTKSIVDRIKFEGPANAQQIHWDDALSGFGVRVYPSGKKSFVIKYRHKQTQCVMTIGKYGVITLEEARNKAKQLLAKLLDGVNPIDERRKAQRGATVREFAADYLERHAKVHKKSWRSDEARIKRHVVPRFGTKLVNSVTKSDISKLHHEMTKVGVVYEANRVLELLGVMFHCAKQWGIYDGDNPAHGIKHNREEKRDRWVTHEELPRLAEAIDGEESIHIRSALWLYLLTGLRKNELLQAQWENLDWDRRELKIPETKSGRTHYLPLSEEALSLLKNIPAKEGNPYIFPGLKPETHLFDLKRPWDRVRRKAQVEDIRLHDLRRTVGSWLAQKGNTLHLIGRILNHSSQATTAVYARFNQDSMRKALDEHGRNIMGVAGKVAHGEVFELRKSA